MERHRPDGADGDFGSCAPRYRGRRFLSYADLEERYGKSRVTLWRWVRAGLLPAPYETGPNSVGFADDELDERDANLTRRTYAPAVEA
jgi:predicted DNA-binding transcriptional regulator AlpA